jgi:sialate O-acetylesterase
MPIGLVVSNWGGTPIEAWMSPAALAEAGFADRAEAGRQALAEHADRVEDVPFPILRDLGIAKPAWANADHPDGNWSVVTLPGFIEDRRADIDGAVWYRRTITLDTVPPGPATLRLGAIDDFDTTWINGEPVGTTDPATPDAWRTPRVYQVPPAVLREGENVIAVRVFDRGGRGGFAGPASAMRLDVGDDQIELTGDWRSAWEHAHAADPDALRDAADRPRPQNFATALHNAMVAPLMPMTVRGFAWYQGESNTGRADSYEPLLRAMINQWRDSFGTGLHDEPFLIVQLANLGDRNPNPTADDGWARLREAQRRVAADEHNALAVTIDVGDPDDVHPRDKQSVGRRLAMLARRDAYGHDLLAEGPAAFLAKQDGNRIRIAFDFDDGLVLADDSRHAFAVRSTAGDWVWADAHVDQASVVLSLPDDFGKASHVRYAWQINPPAPLRNAAGLPASPFELEVQ